MAHSATEGTTLTLFSSPITSNGPIEFMQWAIHQLTRLPERHSQWQVKLMLNLIVNLSSVIKQISLYWQASVSDLHVVPKGPQNGNVVSSLYPSLWLLTLSYHISPLYCRGEAEQISLLKHIKFCMFFLLPIIVMQLWIWSEFESTRLHLKGTDYSGAW